MVVELKEATARARVSDKQAAIRAGERSRVLVTPPGGTVTLWPADQTSGEGLGLWIVKPRRGLRDASLEMASSSSLRSSFPVVFPEIIQNHGRGVRGVWCLA